MDTIDLNSGKVFDRQFQLDLKHQNKIKKRFEFLTMVPSSQFQMEFIRAQAKEICKYLNTLRLMPFKGWEAFITDSILHNRLKFLRDFYLTVNKFGEYIPDEEKIQKLELVDADPKEFTQSIML